MVGGPQPSQSSYFCPPLLEKEKDPQYWRQQAQQTLRRALHLQQLNTNVAKNIILFLGDGEGWVGRGCILHDSKGVP